MFGALPSAHVLAVAPYIKPNRRLWVIRLQITQGIVTITRVLFICPAHAIFSSFVFVSMCIAEMIFGP